MANKADLFYFNNFVEAADCACKGAHYLVECLTNYQPDKIAEMVDTMHGFEHAGDGKKHEMSAALARAFVTPIEREDLAQLSYDLDEVTDKIEEVLQKLYMYNIQAVRPNAILFAKKAVETCSFLCDIMAEFENFKRSKKLKGLIRDLNDIEEDCDILYLTFMRELMVSSADVMEKMAWHEIYDCLEACVDACEHVSECVDTVIMKNT